MPVVIRKPRTVKNGTKKFKTFTVTIQVESFEYGVALANAVALANLPDAKQVAAFITAKTEQ